MTFLAIIVKEWIGNMAGRGGTRRKRFDEHEKGRKTRLQNKGGILAAKFLEQSKEFDFDWQIANMISKLQIFREYIWLDLRP